MFHLALRMSRRMSRRRRAHRMRCERGFSRCAFVVSAVASLHTIAAAACTCLVLASNVIHYRLLAR